MSSLEKLGNEIARMEAWQFQGDMAADKADAAQHFDNADRARNDAGIYALAAIAEALARIAAVQESIVGTGYIGDRKAPYIRISDPWQDQE